MIGDAAASFVAWRAVSLFALSFAAAAGARIAWHPNGADLLPLLAIAGLLAVAMLAGEALTPTLAGARGPDFERARIWAFTLSIGLWLLGPVAAAVWPRRALLEREVAVFTVLQALFLLAPTVGPRNLTTLANALVLTVLTGLRGGLPAAVGSICFLIGLGSVLFFDHFAQRLGPSRAADGGIFAESIRQGSRLLGPITLALALFFVLAPPRPHAALLDNAIEDFLSEEKIAGAYAQFALVALVGGSVVYYATHLLRRRQPKRAQGNLDLVPARGIEEAIQEKPRRPLPRYEGTRGAIVRAYVRVLQAANTRGFQRRPDQTPREIAHTLRAPSEHLQPLTALFMDARYGPTEPSAQDALAAQSASLAAIAAVERQTAL